MLHAHRMGELGSTATGRDGLRVIDRDVTTALPTHGAPTAESGCDNGAFVTVMVVHESGSFRFPNPIQRACGMGSPSFCSIGDHPSAPTCAELVPSRTAAARRDEGGRPTPP
jgi:hypothetical protein